MEEEVLNAQEASEYLKISKSYLLKMAKENRLPSVRIGRIYRFTRASLNQWINDRLSLASDEGKLCSK
ncbi:MAG: helix-turn-helix domain-containing protein [Chlamydiia bacterium]|jgi:excisionase family DNA binding protein|nr:helix-turn-helix domain-containing protein [Chlamydiia bacterium]